ADARHARCPGDTPPRLARCRARSPRGSGSRSRDDPASGHHCPRADRRSGSRGDGDGERPRGPTCISPRAPGGDGNRGELRGALAMTIADVFMAEDPRIAEAARPVADWLARAPREEVVAGLAGAAEAAPAPPARGHP